MHARHWFRLAAAGIAAMFLGALPAQAQIFMTKDHSLNDNTAVCVSQDDGSLVFPVDGDCGTNLTGSDFLAPIGIQAGKDDSYTLLKNNGEMIVNAPATFRKDTSFVGNTSFAGPVQLNGALTAGSVNTANLTTSTVTADSVTTGSLAADSVSTGTIRVTGQSFFDRYVYANGGLVVGRSLALAADSNVNFNGNAIHNVGAPVEATDAATKGYVDSAITGVQGNVAAISTQIDAINATDARQDGQITAIQATDTRQDGQIAAIQATDTRQDGQIAGIQATDTRQDAQITAIQAVDAQQTAQITTLQDQVRGIQGDVAGLRQDIGGLRQDIRRANAGIAAAVALGGTMVVPDSKVSVSFNLATYRGQQGYSAALVGQLAPRIYANVGVAGSTVRGSSTGRVGIAFGF